MYVNATQDYWISFQLCVLIKPMKKKFSKIRPIQKFIFKMISKVLID